MSIKHVTASVTLALSALTMTLGGCATIVNGTSQNVTVDTKDAKGQTVSDSICSVNDSQDTFASGNKVHVSRAYADMSIVCTSKTQKEPAKATVVSGSNGLAFGNILLGGPIGLGVDLATGANFSYPEWVQMVYGQDMTFSRSSGTGTSEPVQATSSVAIGASTPTSVTAK